MKTAFWVLFGAVALLSLLARRPWAAYCGMAAGAALVLCGYAAAVPVRTVILALLAACAAALLAGRGRSGDK